MFRTALFFQNDYKSKKNILQSLEQYKTQNKNLVPMCPTGRTGHKETPKWQVSAEQERKEKQNSKIHKQLSGLCQGEEKEIRITELQETLGSLQGSKMHNSEAI